MSAGAGTSTSSLTPLFEPRSIAVFGASRDPRKLGHTLLANVLAQGFPGRVVPVNPAGEPVLGLPTVGELEEPVDLADGAGGRLGPGGARDRRRGLPRRRRTLASPAVPAGRGEQGDEEGQRPSGRAAPFQSGTSWYSRPYSRWTRTLVGRTR